MPGQNNYLQQQVLVLGVGNVLLQDEGFGVHVVKDMALGSWPEQVEFIDGGTAGMEMIHLFEGVSRLIIIDSLDAKTEPGSIFKFKPGDIANLPRGIGVSFHDVGLLEVLHVARILDCLPDTVIFGIQPKTVDWGMELTPELSKVKARVIELVAQEIVSNGGEASA
jgi:hydrogenase maturation protease